MVVLLQVDLTFLAFCNNDDLDILVQYLTKTKKGNKRFNETLTSKKSYKDNYPKFVLSMDDLPLSEDGILQQNIIDFLLQ